MSSALRYYPSTFSILPLPYREIQLGKNYEKQFPNGGSISLTSNTMIPFGLFGRLALIALNTLAYKSDSENIVYTDSLFSMLKAIKGISPTGAQLRKFEQQLIAWTNTLVTVSYVTDTSKNYKNLLLIENGEFFLERNKLDNSSLIKFTIQGKKFLTTNTVPLPIVMLEEINQPLEFDLFLWLILAIYSCEADDYEQIAWNKLYMQFGISPTKYYDFRNRVRSILSRIIARYYPDSKVFIDKTKNGGIFLAKSSLTVNPELQKEYVSFPLINKQKEEVL